MLDQSRPRRSPARYLAPLALVAVAVATYSIVKDTTGGTARKARPPAPHLARRTVTAPARTTSTAQPGASSSASYVVRPGDSLSVIASRTGVPLATLEQLNPGVSSNALQVGQRLKLRR